MSTKNIYAIVDTETAGNFSNPLCYDISTIFFDAKGNELFKKCYIINEVWNNSELFNTAYYSYKRPLYDEINKEYYNTKDFALEFSKKLTEYKVTHIIGYNINFDLNSLQNTVKTYTGRNIKFTKQIYDIWTMCCELIMNTQNYKNFCRENGFISQAGNYLSNAEVAYRYVTNNINFIEDHTALSDCEIEKMLFLHCLSKKKKFTREVINMPWRMIQDKKQK